MTKVLFVLSVVFLTLTLSCKSTNQESLTKIVGGIETDDFPSVVKLEVLLTNPDDAANPILSICSATFVSEKTALTAAHCFMSSKPGVNYISVSYNGINAEKVFVHPLYVAPATLNSRNIPGVATNDIAVVIFPQIIAPASTHLYTSVPANGTKAKLIGFGCNDVSALDLTKCLGVGEKRVGENVISVHPIVADSSVLTVAGPVEASNGQASIGSGDSGGPLIINGKVAGIASLTYRVPQQNVQEIKTLAEVMNKTSNKVTNATLYSYYANLSSKGTYEFLKSTTSHGAYIPDVSAVFLGIASSDQNLTNYGPVLLLKVYENTRAHMMHLNSDDMLTHIDGKRITNFAEFEKVWAEKSVGDDVKWNVIRKNPSTGVLQQYEWTVKIP